MRPEQDILTRPLFSDDWERAHCLDEWSFPKGIARDGMVGLSMDMRTLADQYFDSAEAVISLIMDNKVPDYTVANPILYMYRHAVELYLKVAIEKQSGKPYKWLKGENGHELDKIVQRAPNISDAARARIFELHALDPKSTHLRFGEPGFSGPEGWAELTELQGAMRALQAHLCDLINRLETMSEERLP